MLKMNYFLMTASLIIIQSCSEDKSSNLSTGNLNNCDFFRKDGTRVLCEEGTTHTCEAILESDAMKLFGNPISVHTVTSCSKDSVLKICSYSIDHPELKYYVYESYPNSSICTGKVLEYQKP
jgi:hypothetical protein